MKKLWICFLALLTVCNLFGCTPTPPDDVDNERYTATDILVYQSITMAQQISACAQPAFVQHAIGVESVISITQTFTEATQSDPVECQIITTDDPLFAQNIILLSSQLLGMDHLACTSVLSNNMLMRFPKTLSETTVVYLRYSEECHFVITFVPGENKVVSAVAYPIFDAVAEALLQAYFSDASTLNASQIRNTQENGAKASVDAKCTGKTVSDDHYANLAKSIFANATDNHEANLDIHNQAIVDNVLKMQQALKLQPYAISVHTFPASIQQEINNMLVGAAHLDLLQPIAARKMYLTFPSRFNAIYGENAIVSSSLLQTTLQTPQMGSVAQEDESPVLVVMGFTSDYSVIMAIYPDEHNLYYYSYASICESYDQIINKLENFENIP